VTILFVGDVCGRPGRAALRKLLPELRREHDAHFAIVNGENSAAGFGITPDTAAEMFDAGADVITTGNHVWAQKGAYDLLDRDRRILRPANYPPGVPGQGSGMFRAADGRWVGVINLLGRTFMHPVDCPFRAGLQAAEELMTQCDAVIVDFHAEATSEKAALAHYMDGQVTAVIGTHTHVQTADERVLAGGTAFISDCGMTGPTGTIIGVTPDIVIRRFVNALPARFEVPRGGEAQLNAVVLRTDTLSVRATGIARIQALTNSDSEVS